VRVVQLVMCLAEARALPLSTIPEVLRILVTQRRGGRIFYGDVGHVYPMTACDVLYVIRVANEDRLRDSLVDELLRGADDLGLVPFGEDDPFGISLRAVDETADDSARAAKPAFELIPVLVEIDELVGCSAGDRGPRDRRRDPQQHARVEREGNQIVRPEVHRLQAVQPRNALGDVFLG